jgi:hypothetical protein
MIELQTRSEAGEDVDRLIRWLAGFITTVRAGKRR